MDLSERISNELLPYVNQPAQYIGGEFNQLVKPGDWSRAEVRLAIAFPDVYGIGMSHLGSQILYWMGNHTPGVCAERVYTPWTDAERIMRDKRIPLFTWDTRQPVARADILAFSIQYELAYTNVLMMLELAGLPRHARDRGEGHPIVIAGGPQVDNPEPVAEFFDLIVIGDGEPSLSRMLDIHRRMKREGASREAIIQELAQQCEYVYAPKFYAFDYHDDGTIARIRPSAACPDGNWPRERIVRCTERDLEHAPFPTRPLVPHIQIVHDRIAIEVMRGCPQRCRFCHAGYTKRPLGWRRPDRILDIAEQAYRATGHEEIGLLSLSTADYPKLGELAERVNAQFADRHVNLSVPSLRVDKMLSSIPWLVNSVRKGGLTLAVETARDDMRSAIRKKVTDGNLMDGVKQAYEAGWNSVKLYFMCGFPGETEDDIRGIFELARQVSLAKREVRGGPAAVTASVSWLVPKPHTPLQWAPQADADYCHRVRRILREEASRVKNAVRIKTHRVESSLLEGVLSRGDRRLAPVIERAYRLGARMDGWEECFRYDLWQQAFDQTGVDPAFYAHRVRRYDEILPWGHIQSGPRHDYLVTQSGDYFVRLGRPMEQGE